MKAAGNSRLRGKSEEDSFEVSNKFSLIRKGLAKFVANPVEALSGLSAASKIKTQLERENINLDDTNAVLKSNTISSIIRDEGLFHVLYLESLRISNFIDKNHDVLIYGIGDIVFNPSSLTDETKLHLANEILSNPAALKSVIGILENITPQMERVVKGEKFKNDILRRLNLQDLDVATMLPEIIGIIKALEPHRLELAELMNKAPTISIDNPASVEEALPIALNLLRDSTLVNHVSNIISEKNLTALWPIIRNNIPQAEFQNEKYIPLILDTTKAMVGATPTLVSELEELNRKGIVHKIIAKINDKDNEVNVDNDFRGNELKELAEAAISAAQRIGIPSLLIKHEDLIEQAGESYLNAIVPKSAAKLMKIANTSLSELLDDKNLTIIKEQVLPELPMLLEGNTNQKKSFGLKVGAVILDILKSDKFKEIYNSQVIPLIKENKQELGEVIDKIKADMPKMNKFSKIKGEDIISLLEEPDTLKRLADIYTHVKDGNYIKAGVEGVKTLSSSKDLRSITFHALSALISEGLRVMVPGFIRRMLIGDRMHSIMSDCLKNNQGGDIMLAFENHEKKPHDSILDYSLKNRACFNLDFRGLQFESCTLKHFDFRYARFGSKKSGTDFANSKFRDCNFSEAEFYGGVVNLENTNFDLKSFKSLLPTLDKLCKKGVEINIEKMFIHDLKKTEIQNLTENSPFLKKYGDELKAYYKNNKHSMKIELEKENPPLLAKLIK